MSIKRFTGACKAADRRLSLGCIGAFQSAEWAVVKRLTDTDPVVDKVLNGKVASDPTPNLRRALYFI